MSVYEMGGAAKPAGGGWEWDEGAGGGGGNSFYGELSAASGRPVATRRRGRVGLGVFLIVFGGLLIGGAFYFGFRIEQLTSLFGGGA